MSLRRMVALLSAPQVSWRAVRVWQRNFDVFRKLWLSQIFWQFLEPIFYMVAFGVGLGAYLSDIDGVSYLKFLGPGLLVAYPMYAAGVECTYGSYTRMEVQRTFDAIIATPLNIEDVIGGEILWGATRSVITGAVFLMVIYVFGLVDSALALLVIPLIFLEGLLFAALSLIFTACSPNYEFFNYYFTLGMTLQFFFGGVFFPLDNMPSWVRSVAWFFPLAHLVTPARHLIRGDLTSDIIKDVIWLAVPTFILINLSVNLIKRRLIK